MGFLDTNLIKKLLKRFETPQNMRIEKDGIWWVWL